jgi:hypothetical protein
VVPEGDSGTLVIGLARQAPPITTWSRAGRTELATTHDPPATSDKPAMTVPGVSFF